MTGHFRALNSLLGTLRDTINEVESRSIDE